MKAQCLPFRQLPHTTRLFADFLEWSPGLRQFYSRPPRFLDWIKDETSRLRYDDSRRARVATVLERQNKTWGASTKTLENISRFRAGASALVTGQQVGLLGGPVFSLYKALTAIKLANQATAAGVDCVPVFWLATEDHDLEEINHLKLPGPDASLQTVTASPHGVPDAPVGSVVFGEEIQDPVTAALALLGESAVGPWLLESYLPGENFGSAFAKLFTHLFGDWGVVLLDASDPELHAIAEPIYRGGIEKAAELDDALRERGKALEAAGYHQQVKLAPSSTLVFALREGARIPVHRRANGGAEFVIGDKRIDRPELLRRIAAAPHEFSANVLLRPVVQDYLLPTLAYTGGAAEVAYFAQAGAAYQTLLGRVTPIIPRFSATIIEPKPQTLLERYGLGFTDVLRGPEWLGQHLAAQTLPQDLQKAFEGTAASLGKSLATIRELLGRLDKTLVDAADNAGSKMHHQLQSLRDRAARAELRQSEVLERHARLLSNALFPDKTLQEREIAGVYFVGQHGKEILQELYEFIHTECLDHQVISV